MTYQSTRSLQNRHSLPIQLLRSIMLFSGFLILFFTVVFADSVAVISAKYSPPEDRSSNSLDEPLDDKGNHDIISTLLVEKLIMREGDGENGTSTCGQAYKECIGKIDQDEPYNDVCAATLQCTADYFECRNMDSNSTTPSLPNLPPSTSESYFKLIPSQQLKDL